MKKHWDDNGNVVSRESVMKKRNGSERTHAEPMYPLFTSIEYAVKDGNPQFRDDFFIALRQDIPDLDAMFQAQENADTPEPAYVSLLGLSRGWRAQDNGATRGTDIADQIQSLHQHLPQPIIGDHPNFRFNVYRGDAGSIPLALILDNDQFKTTVGSVNSKEIIALLVADLLASSEKGGQQRIFSEPEAAARIELLLSKCDPERVAMHFLRTPERNDGNVALTKTSARSEPWAQQMTTLFVDEIAPRVQALLAARKDNEERQKSYKGNTEEIPVNGATVMLLEARSELETVLAKKTVKGKWLNRLQVWDAVRKTSLQTAFIGACVRCDAFRELKPKQDVPAPDVDTGNKLLQGLALLGDELPAPTANSTEAAEAFRGYMESIQSPRDLSSIARALRALNTRENPVLTLAADALSDTAKRIGYSARDAYLMMSNFGWDEAPTDRSTALVKALNNGRWTATDIDEVFSSRPSLHNARHLVALLGDVVESNPKIWTDFSDTTIYKLAIGWAHSGAITMWADEEGYVAPFEARLAALGRGEKSRIFSSMVSYQWNDSSSKGHEITHRFAKAILNSIPDTEKEAFIEQSYQVFPNKFFLTDLIDYLDAPLMQKELVQSLAGDKKGGRLHKLARLLGYGTSFDKKATLEALPNDLAREAFGDLLTHIQHRDMNQLRYRRYPLEEKDGVQEKINLLKNMAFDLYEHLTPLFQTPIMLNERSRLVQSGVAQKGDLLAWDGFCHLVAPFLEEPRPALDAKPEPPAQQSTKVVRQQSIVLDRDTIKTQLSQGVQSIWSDDYDRVRPQVMCNEMHPMFSMPPLGAIKMMLGGDALHNYMSENWFPTPQAEVKPEVQPEVQVVDIPAEHKTRQPR